MVESVASVEMSDSAEPKETEERMKEAHLEISDMSQENFIWYVASQISSRFMDFKVSYELVRLIYDTLVSKNINNDTILEDFYIPNNKDIQEIQGIQNYYEVTHKYEGNLHNRICKPIPEDELTTEELAEFLVQKPIFSSRLLTKLPFSSPVPLRTGSDMEPAGGYSGINKKKHKSRKNKKTRRKTRRNTRRKTKKIRTRKNKQVRRKH
jgi:hypothetical protein